MERTLGIPNEAYNFHLFQSDAQIKSHASYYAGKAGDTDAALRLVEDVAVSYLSGLRQTIPTGITFVSPYAKEAAGDNALPLMLSLVCAEIFGGESDTEIVQLQRVFHTGADPMERLRLRPSFDGAVQPNREYFLVDDVSSMGTTLAELANYLQVNGGRVAGTLLLVNAGRSTAFKPAAKHIRLLEERYGEEIRQIFGIHTRALTANEAGYLVGFRTADEIRNRLVKAEKETRLRLLSKGY